MRALVRLLLPMCLILGFPAFGVEPKTGDGGLAIKKFQGLIRQISQEKSALEAEKAAWLAEKTEMNAKLKSLEAGIGKLQSLPAEIERYKAGLESMKAAFESQQGQLGQERQNRQAVVQKYNEVIVKANAIYADNQLLVRAVREREEWIEQCGALNRKLQTANLEILNKYREKGLLQQLGELEPFTGLGQVETETTVEEYKYQLKQLKMTHFKAAETGINVKSTQATVNEDANLPTTNDGSPVNKAVVTGVPSAEPDAGRVGSANEADSKPAMKP